MNYKILFQKKYIRGNYVKNLEKKSFQRNKGEIREQPEEDEKKKNALCFIL